MSDTDRPDIVPLYPRRGHEDEARKWRTLFLWVSSRPPADFRQDPKARALIAAAEAFIDARSSSARPVSRPLRRKPA